MGWCFETETVLGVVIVRRTPPPPQGSGNMKRAYKNLYAELQYNHQT
jgi:hypothetical protein